MKVLLTGATGFLGSRTLERLFESPSVTSIIATGRVNRKSRFISHPKISYHFGSLEDRAFVNSIIRDVDIIINTASLSSPWGKRKQFITANIDSQLHLIEGASSGKVSRFIYISSPSIYFNGKDRFEIKESDPLPDVFINAYAWSKREAEKLLERSSIPYVILRPRALIGRGDTVIMPRLIKAVDENKLRVIGRGKNVVDLTSVDNAVDAILQSITVNNEGLNQAYNISNGAPVELWKCINEVLTRLNKTLPQKNVSLGLVNFLARFLELKSKMITYKEPVLTVYSVGTLARSFTMDITKARTLLNYEPRVSTEQAMIDFVRWYNDNYEKNQFAS